MWRFLLSEPNQKPSALTQPKHSLNIQPIFTQQSKYKTKCDQLSEGKNN